MTEMGDDLLTVPEVSTYLRKSASTIYRLTRQGKLPAKKVGGTWRYSRRGLDEWLRATRAAPTVEVIPPPTLGQA
jgi:excisionase family DNA binding protein